MELPQNDPELARQFSLHILMMQNRSLLTQLTGWRSGQMDASGTYRYYEGSPVVRSVQFMLELPHPNWSKYGVVVPNGESLSTDHLATADKIYTDANVTDVLHYDIDPRGNYNRVSAGHYNSTPVYLHEFCYPDEHDNGIVALQGFRHLADVPVEALRNAQ